jgi:hypothetical protein
LQKLLPGILREEEYQRRNRALLARGLFWAGDRVYTTTDKTMSKH